MKSACLLNLAALESESVPAIAALGKETNRDPLVIPRVAHIVDLKPCEPSDNPPSAGNPRGSRHRNRQSGCVH